MTKRFFAFFFLIFSFCQIAEASRGAGNKIYFSVAAKGGLGKAGSQEESFYKSRDLVVYGGDLTLGYVLGFVMLGASAEYNIWDQRTEPKDVGETNLSGKQLNLAPSIGFGFRNLMLQVKPYLSSTMTLNQKSIGGEKVKFSKPTNSFSTQLLYSLGKSYLGVEYALVKYKEVDVGGEASDLSGDNQVNFSAVRLVYGYKF